MERKPGLTFHNPKPYSKKGERFILRLEAYTDHECGMWHDAADLMLWLSAMPFIHSVKLLEVGPELHNVKKETFVEAARKAKTQTKSDNEMEGMKDERGNQKEG